MTLQTFLLVLQRSLSGCVLMRIMAGRAGQCLFRLQVAFRLQQPNGLKPDNPGVLSRNITFLHRLLATVTSRADPDLIRRAPWVSFEATHGISRDSVAHQYRMAATAAMAVLATDIWNKINDLVACDPARRGVAFETAFKSLSANDASETFNRMFDGPTQLAGSEVDPTQTGKPGNTVLDSCRHS
ncbi:MAG: hypothetical protein RIK87_28005 [Fuerstiella sp.]